MLPGETERKESFGLVNFPFESSSKSEIVTVPQVSCIGVPDLSRGVGVMGLTSPADT